eukprot:12928230-Prorocentrum_lima.AAC.1
MQGRAKKTVIQQMVGRGVTVALQETHWGEGQRGIWAPMFPHATVVHSAAQAHDSGPKGGVAL